MPSARANGMPMAVPLVEEEPVEEVFYAEPFEAWRAWNVVELDNSLMLQSITYKTFWPFQEEMVAGCAPDTSHGGAMQYLREHTPPDREHACGIYSVKRPSQALRWKDYGTVLTPLRMERPRVYGKVKIWGRILPYTEGYLSEKAYPSHILVPHSLVEHGDLDPREVRRELEKNYRVKAQLA